MHSPLKKTEPEQSPSGSKMKTSLKRSVHQRKAIQQFNPSIYMTSAITQQDVIQIKEAFDQFDSNQMGILTPNDLKLALFKQNFHASKQTIYNIIAEYDLQCIGGLTFPAFIEIIISDPVEKQRVSDLKKVFRKYDRGSKGYMERIDLQQVVKSLQENCSPKDIDDIFSAMDFERNGKVSFDSFVKVMHNPASFQ